MFLERTKKDMQTDEVDLMLKQTTGWKRDFKMLERVNHKPTHTKK